MMRDDITGKPPILKDDALMPVLINGPSKKAAAARENGKVGGRPPIEIDLTAVKRLASFMVTDAEIAQFLGISKRSIRAPRSARIFRRR
jgi:hypothetical protein